MKNVLLASASVALALTAGVAFADVNSDNNNLNSNLTNTTVTTSSSSANQANSNSTGNNNTSHFLSNNNVASYNTEVDDHQTFKFGSDNSVVDSGNTVGDVTSGDTVSISNGYHGNTNAASFSDNTNVTSSALAATIASSHVDFRPDHGDNYEGNDINAQAFQGVNGIATANQNVAINANVQQSVSVSVGNVGIGGNINAPSGL